MTRIEGLLGSLNVLETNLPGYETMVSLSHEPNLSVRRREIGQILAGKADIQSYCGGYFELVEKFLPDESALKLLITIEKKYLAERKQLRLQTSAVGDETADQTEGMLEGEMKLDKRFLSDLLDLYERTNGVLRSLISRKLAYYVSNVVYRGQRSLSLSKELLAFKQAEVSDLASYYQQEADFFRNNIYMLTNELKVMAFFSKVTYLGYDLGVLFNIVDRQTVEPLLVNYEFYN
jgi:hypothetical protein